MSDGDIRESEGAALLAQHEARMAARVPEQLDYERTIHALDRMVGTGVTVQVGLLAPPPVVARGILTTKLEQLSEGDLLTQYLVADCAQITIGRRAFVRADRTYVDGVPSIRLASKIGDDSLSELTVLVITEHNAVSTSGGEA